MSCHFRVLKSYHSWRYILVRSPSSTARESKWQSVSWHWHRQLRTMFICVSCTILFVLPIRCITTCRCLLWTQLMFTKQNMHSEYMWWLVAGWTNANRKPKINKPTCDIKAKWFIWNITEERKRTGGEMKRFSAYWKREAALKVWMKIVLLGMTDNSRDMMSWQVKLCCLQDF